MSSRDQRVTDFDSPLLSETIPVPLPDADWVRLVVTHCAHDRRGRGFPEAAIGCQRESVHDLGFGWLYFGLVRACDLQAPLVIGSGRGFSVACMALGLAGRTDRRVVLVDPGYEQWSVDGQASDVGAGLWASLPEPSSHFRDHLGLNNVEVLRMRSDEAFERLRSEGRRFDLVLVDGDHSGEQSLRDLRNALSLLTAHGWILAHDTSCRAWPGPALAVAALLAEEPLLDGVTLPAYPGLTLLQRRQSLLRIRPASREENDRVNAWRRAGGVVERPLPDGDDPRPGESRGDPREGLFAVYEGDQLIGGFGIRHRTFRRAGADDFPPYTGEPVTGFLRYGAVLDPAVRGRGRWPLVHCQVMRWFAREGLYLITEYPVRYRTLPFRLTEVGRTPQHVAYHCRHLESRRDDPGRGLFWVDPDESLLDRIRDLEADMARRAEEQVEIIARRSELEERLKESESALAELNERYRTKVEEMGTHALSLRQTIQDRESALAELTDGYRAKLDEMAGRATALQEIINGKEEGLLEMTAESHQLRATLDGVLSSRSWRLTRPLRDLFARARAIRSRLR